MHGNAHVALGIIIAGIASFFIELNFWTAAFIVACSFMHDFDIFLLKYIPKGNHRLFFTHSIYPALLLGLLGFILSQYWLVIAGIAYLSHLTVDSIDWGLNLFYTGKLYGLRTLLPTYDMEELERILAKEPIRQFYFPRRYYAAKWVKITEIFLLCAMVAVLILLIPQYWYFGFLYPFLFSYHALEYWEFTNRLKGKSAKIRLLTH
jgi:hypothetical protein